MLFSSVDDVYNLLRDSLYLIRNQQFIDTFKAQFVERILTVKKDHLKAMQSHQNPLVHLININQTQDGSNTLVKELIGLATSKITLSAEDVLNDTFYRPSRQTFTYAILFDKSLNSYPISQTAIDYLNAQWEKWTAAGVRANDVWKWKGFSADEQSVVRQIWALTTTNSKAKYPIDTLFNATDREMQAKLQIKEAIVTCLNAYCQHAADKDNYYVEIQKWQQQLEREVIQSIEIPRILQNIVPFTKDLNPFRNVHSWRTFLNQQTVIQGN